MPAIVPSRVSTGPSGSTAQAVADVINHLRDLMGQVTGIWPVTAVTIASDVIAPWTTTGDTITAGAMLRIDTEGGAAADNLDRIDPTGLLDTASASACRQLYVAIASAARTVTIRHARGSTGEIRTADGQDWLLSSPAQIVVMIWDPAASPRCWRALGMLAAPVVTPWAQPLRLETWTTAGRPASPATGRCGLNVTTGRLESWTGASWQAPLADPDWTGTRSILTGATAYADLSHGLGAKPRVGTVHLECLSAELGYSVGDEVPIEHVRSGDGSIAMTVAWRSNVLAISQRVTPQLIRLDTPGNAAAITPSSWRIIARAWR